MEFPGYHQYTLFTKEMVRKKSTIPIKKKLRDYAHWRRRAQHHDLMVGDALFVSNLINGKLTPNVSGDNCNPEAKRKWYL